MRSNTIQVNYSKNDGIITNEKGFKYRQKCFFICISEGLKKHNITKSD